MDQEQPMLDLINFLHAFTFGSLWWVRDTVWVTVKEDFHMKNAKKRHPGCCIGQREFTSLNQTVPMLFGSHSNSCGFFVGSLSAKDAALPRKGYFAVRPYPIMVSYVIGKDPDIQRNSFKPELTAEEENDLKAYLIAKGVRIDE